jgi:hypothetical protein
MRLQGFSVDIELHFPFSKHHFTLIHCRVVGVSSRRPVTFL